MVLWEKCFDMAGSSDQLRPVFWYQLPSPAVVSIERFWILTLHATWGTLEAWGLVDRCCLILPWLRCYERTIHAVMSGLSRLCR